MANIYKHTTSSRGGPDSSVAKVAGVGMLTAGGAKLIKSIAGGAKGTIEKIDNNQSIAEKMLEDSENIILKVESSEIVKALFDLPLEETSLKDKIVTKNFVAFKNYNKYVK